MRLQKLLIAFALCLYLSVVVYAHPGSTDSDGGHFNRKTGEYHYHHGYSAHQHSDTDGDGDLDCPYSFDDKTDHSSNETGSATISKTPSLEHTLPPIIIEPPAIKNESQNETTNKKTISDYFDIICYSVFGLFLLTAILEGVADEIKKRHKK